MQNAVNWKPEKTGCMDAAMRRLWNQFDEMPEDLRLYEGTALALYLDHRTSTDFDFATPTGTVERELVQRIPALRGGEITEGHARALLSVSDLAARVRLLTTIKQQGLSVREAERWAEGADAERRKRPSRRRSPDDEAWRREVGSALDRIQRNLGTRVRVRGGEKRGRVEMEYYSAEELTQLIDRLTAA